MNSQPNILFLFPDQLRSDFISIAGRYPVRTPNVEALSHRGVYFSHVATPAPICAPARACIASGNEYGRSGVMSNRDNFPTDRDTIYSRMRSAGYAVLGCGKFDLHKPDLTWGEDGHGFVDDWGFTDGVDNEGKLDGLRAGRSGEPGPYIAHLTRHGLREVHLDDFARRRDDLEYDTSTPSPLPPEHYCDNWIGRTGIDLLESVPVGTPWFLQVNFAGPHSPFDVTPEMMSWYSGDEFECPPESSCDPTTLKHAWRNYAAMTGNIDRIVGEYLHAVEKRGETDNTIVVFASDHGEMLGFRDSWGKEQPYQSSLSVPLVVAGPGVSGARVVDAPTNLLDLSATFLQLAGVEVPQDMDSRSLLPVLSGESDATRPMVRAGLYDWRLVLSGPYKLIRWDDGRTELYDLESDRSEQNDLSDREPHVVQRLLELMSTE